MYKLLLKWKEPVAEHWDNALMFKRQSVRTKLAKNPAWNDEEDEPLRQLWPAADKLDLHKAFPRFTGGYIKTRATTLGLRRNRRMPEKCSPIQMSLYYEDWAHTCESLNVEPESEEGAKVLKMLNHYARTTEKDNALLAFWWILPVVEMNRLEERWACLELPAPSLTSMQAQC